MFDLQPLLEPRSVAVLGASRTAGRPGNLLLRNIVNGGYPGRLHGVNPSARGIDIHGVPTVADVADIGEAVDLAMVCLPREAVLAGVEHAISHGARAVAVVTAGFAEADDWGVAEQQRLVDLGDRHGVPIIGPNTIGTVSMGGRFRASFAELPVWSDGPIAIVAQTGIYTGAVLQTLAARGTMLGIRASVDMGNRSNLTEEELVQHFLNDGSTTTVGCYLERPHDAQRLAEVIAARRSDQHVVLLLPTGSRAAYESSRRHTGSDRQLQQADVAAVVQAGAVMARSSAEFVAAMRTGGTGNAGRGGGVAVVTGSGAVGVMATGQALDAGLRMAEFAPSTVAKVRDRFPDWQQVANPLDLWFGTPNADALLHDALLAVADDADVGHLLVTPLALAGAGLAGMLTAIEAICRRPGSRVAVHVVAEGLEADAWCDAAARAGAVVHGDTAAAVSAIAAFAATTAESS
jgi:acetyltransferase